MRKAFTLVILFITLFIILVSPHQTSAQSDTGWVINLFNSDITINPDTSVEVVETIEVDFGSLQKRGIYRDIPVKYTTRLGNKLDIRFVLLSVKDQMGHSLRVKTEKQGDNINIRIGDQDTYVGGKKTYVISYQVQRVINEFSDSAEFYWNATGNDWPVPIELANAIVRSPTVLNTICYTGYHGSSEQNCYMQSSARVASFSAGNLLPGQGLTIAVRGVKQKFMFPSRIQKRFGFYRITGYTFSPFLSLY